MVASGRRQDYHMTNSVMGANARCVGTFADSLVSTGAPKDSAMNPKKLQGFSLRPFPV